MHAPLLCLGGPFDGQELRRLGDHIIREGPFAGALFLRTEDDSACFVIDRTVYIYSLHRGQGTLTYMGSFRDENGTPRRPRRRNGSSPT